MICYIDLFPGRVLQHSLLGAGLCGDDHWSPPGLSPLLQRLDVHGHRRDLPLRGPGGHDAGALLGPLPPHLAQQAEGGPLAGADSPGARHVRRGLYHVGHCSLRARTQERLQLSQKFRRTDSFNLPSQARDCHQVLIIDCTVSSLLSFLKEL